MILLHRITPFVITALCAAAYGLLVLAPFSFGKLSFVLFACIPLFFARLLLWEVRRPAFWVFLGTPMLLLVSSISIFMLLESSPPKWALAVFVTLALGLYAENIFSFYHLPSTYQAYALEYLTLMFAVTSAFFFTSSAFMAQLFLELPLWMAAILVWAIMFMSHLAVFWVSKIGFETGLPFALTGAVLMTELFVALSFLPTSFISNAAVFSVVFATYMGIARAELLDALTPTIVRQYAILAIVFLVAILGTATWV